jgi:hypothetical protein
LSPAPEHVDDKDLHHLLADVVKARSGHLDSEQSKLLEFARAQATEVASATGTFLLVNGHFFEPAELPKGINRGEVGACHRNASRLVESRAELSYAEGYAVGPDGGIVEHAWAVDLAKRAIDPTFAGLAYLGIPLKDTAWQGPLSPLHALALDWLNGLL